MDIEPWHHSSIHFAAIERLSSTSKQLPAKLRFDCREHLLGHAIDQLSLDGMVLEFGVYSGKTINFLADKLPNVTIYGFDSFRGLPEDWRWDMPKGFFARDDRPAVRSNVELVVGMFDRTLPFFLDDHPEKASLVHIDCDLYYSTQTVLTQLRKSIVSGTIIVFDEYYNYPGWEEHEFLAFQEFVNFNRIKFEYIGLAPAGEQVAVRIS